MSLYVQQRAFLSSTTDSSNLRGSMDNGADVGSVQRSSIDPIFIIQIPIQLQMVYFLYQDPFFRSGSGSGKQKDLDLIRSKKILYKGIWNFGKDLYPGLDLSGGSVDPFLDQL